jgi:hypothetical protein
MASIRYFPMGRGPLGPAVNTMAGWLITSYFGGRVDPLTGRAGNHGGMDLAYAGCHGKPFYAVNSGRVYQSWDGSGGGNWTSLQCDNGDYFGYGHALRFAPGVNGRWVEAGTWLGDVDSTGGSTGSHMHFAYRPRGSGSYQDPFDILREASLNNRIPGEAEVPPPDPEPEVPITGDDEEVISPEAQAWFLEEFSNVTKRDKLITEGTFRERLGTTLARDPRDGKVWHIERPGLFRTYVQGPANLDWLLAHGVPYVGDLDGAAIDAFYAYPPNLSDADVAKVASFTADEIAERLSAAGVEVKPDAI